MRDVALGLVLTVAGAAAILARPALADDAPPGLELRWEAEAGCPTEAEFVAEVERVLGRPVSDLVRPFRVEVKLEAVEQGWAIALTTEGPDGAGQRRFGGETCAAAAKAGAFVVALAIRELPALETESTPVPAPTPEPVDVAPAPRAPRVVPEESLVSEVPDDPAAFALSLGGGLDTGSLPGLAPTTTLSAAYLGRFLGLAAVLGYSPAQRATATDLVDVYGEFDLMTLGARGCLQLEWVSPCIGVEIGILRGSGHGVEVTRDRTHGWTALALGLRRTWNLSQSLGIFGELATVFPGDRPRFQIDGEDLFVPAAVVGRWLMGVELRIP